MQIYIDLLMLLNFLVDLLLILGTNRLSGHGLGCKRAIPAAMLGGIYAGACVLPGFAFLGSLFWRLVSLGLMSAIAFGANQSGLRRGVVFVLLSMALGGIALGLSGGGFWSLVLSAAGICFLCLVGFRGRVGQQQYVPIAIHYGGQNVSLTALVDTGNTLRDPVSGRNVLVVDAAVGAKLLRLSAAQLAHPVETLATANLPGLRLIPYRAVGCPGGLLLGIRPDRVEVDGKEKEYIIAFAPQNLGHGQYQALAGGAL